MAAVGADDVFLHSALDISPKLILLRPCHGFPEIRKEMFT